MSETDSHIPPPPSAPSDAPPPSAPPPSAPPPSAPPPSAPPPSAPPPSAPPPPPDPTFTGDDDFGEDPRQLKLFVSLDGFEGPIDMLLAMAREQKVDLRHIAILPLAEQYLEFIRTAKDLDIDIAADYLVMAAWLAYLKSRLLIPEPEADETDEATDMAEALRLQLMRLEAMQKKARELMAMPRLGQQRFANGQGEEFAARITTEFRATLFDLLTAYGYIASKDVAETLTIAQSDLFTVEDAVERLQALLKTAPGWAVLQSFLPEGLRSALDHRSALASHFTASLELVRDGHLKIRQEAAFGPIWLARNTK